MKCFYHPSSDAAGLCTQCGKGGCQHCLFGEASALLCTRCHDLANQVVDAERQGELRDVVRAGHWAHVRLILSGLFPLGGLIWVSWAAIQGGDDLPAEAFFMIPYTFWGFFWGIPAGLKWWYLTVKRFGWNNSDSADLFASGLFLAGAFFSIFAGVLFAQFGGGLYLTYKDYKLYRGASAFVAAAHAQDHEQAAVAEREQERASHE